MKYTFNVVCLAGLAAFLIFAAGTVEPSYLYALRAEATGNQILGFEVNEQTGVLTPLSGFPVATGGDHAVGVFREMLFYSEAHGRLFALNSASDTVSVFAVDPNTGGLSALSYSPISVAGGGSWRCLAVHPSGSPLVVGNAGYTTVASYALTNSTATAAAGSPFDSDAYSYSIVFSHDGQYLYAGSAVTGTLAGFQVSPATGVLSALAGSPFDTGWVDPGGGDLGVSQGFAVDSSGRLFMIFFDPTDLRAFTTSSGFSTGVSGNPFSSGLTGGSDGLLHPEGFYMVADMYGDRVGVYRVGGSGSGTTLSAVPGSPYTTGGSDPRMLAFDEAAGLLFVSHESSRNITTFKVNATTGGLTSLSLQSADSLGTTGAICGLTHVTPLIFADGFEAGNTGAWSSATP